MKLIGADGRKLADDGRGRDRSRAARARRRLASASGVAAGGRPAADRPRRVRRAPRRRARRAHARRAARRARLRQRRRVRGRAARAARAPAPTSTCSTREPDGRNINDGCGSTHPERLQRAVRRARRRSRPRARRRRRPCARGRRARRAGRRRPDHGDHRARLARARHAARRRDRVTVMSNLGSAPGADGRAASTIVETPVGDRNVVAAMAERTTSRSAASSRATSCSPTSRPPATACSPGLLVADLVARRGVPLSTLAGGDDPLAAGARQRAARAVAVDLDDARRSARRSRRSRPSSAIGAASLVRPSGTEPVVRVMVEAPDRSGGVGRRGARAGGSGSLTDSARCRRRGRCRSRSADRARLRVEDHDAFRAGGGADPDIAPGHRVVRVSAPLDQDQRLVGGFGVDDSCRNPLGRRLPGGPQDREDAFGCGGRRRRGTDRRQCRGPGIPHLVKRMPAGRHLPRRLWCGRARGRRAASSTSDSRSCRRPSRRPRSRTRSHRQPRPGHARVQFDATGRIVAVVDEELFAVAS